MKLSLSNIIPARLNKFMAYRFFNGRAFLPKHIPWLLTYGCNNKCGFCFFYGENGIFKDKKDFETLSFNQIKDIADDIAAFKPSVEIIGGEPFTREDTLKIVRYIKEKGCYCSIFTNANLINEKNCQEVVDSGLDKICIALSGPKEIHDELRSAPGSFDKAVNAIKLLIRYRKAAKPRIEIWFTLFGVNIKYINEMVELAKYLKVDALIIKHLWHSTNKMIEEHNRVIKRYFDREMKIISGMQITSIDSALVMENLEKIPVKSDGFVKPFPAFSRKDIIKFYSQPTAAIKKRCVFPWICASIMPNGDLSCCYHNFVLGNLRNDKFRSLWNNKKATRFRQILKAEKHFPLCLRCGGIFWI